MIYLHTRQLIKKFYLFVRKGLLSAFSGFRKQRAGGAFPPPDGRILILSQRRLGDAVLSLPLFPALKGRFPASSITVLANASIREVFDLCPEVHHVMPVQRGESPGQWARLIREVRKNRFHLVIDLNTDGSLFSGLIAGLSGAEVSIGYEGAGRGIFFDEVLPEPQEEMHLTDLVLSTLAPLGVEHPSRQVVLSLPEEEREIRSGALWRREDVDDLPLLGIHPGATHPTQRWPLEYYAELADKVIETGLGRVILCGGPGDGELIRKVRDRMRERPKIAPPFCSLTEFAALLSRLDYLVCNNSGPLHLACAVGTKTVSFMGPTRAGQWWPAGEGHIVFRRDDLPCIGCNLGRCKMRAHDCMRSVSPEEVFDRIRSRIMNEPKAPQKI